MKLKTTKPKNINQYIKKFPAKTQAKLQQMYKTIKSSAPGAFEGLKWSMPAFSYKRILVTFAGFTHHIGFYPTPSAVTEFSKNLTKYKTARGSIQFPLDRPLPLSLIRKITAFRVKESKQKDKKWRT